MFVHVCMRVCVCVCVWGGGGGGGGCMHMYLQVWSSGQKNISDSWITVPVNK